MDHCRTPRSRPPPSWPETRARTTGANATKTAAVRIPSTVSYPLLSRHAPGRRVLDLLVATHPPSSRYWAAPLPSCYDIDLIYLGLGILVDPCHAAGCVILSPRAASAKMLVKGWSYDHGVSRWGCPKSPGEPTL